MKISKKRLLEIIQEECGMPMKSYEMNPKGEIDREGRMAKRQLSHIAEYAAELSQMLNEYKEKLVETPTHPDVFQDAYIDSDADDQC